MKRTASKPVSTIRFCEDVSEVINRVRTAFGSIPMKAVSDLPEIKAAQTTVERTARLVLNGIEDMAMWRGALIVYETTWLSALRTLQRSDNWAA